MSVRWFNNTNTTTVFNVYHLYQPEHDMADKHTVTHGYSIKEKTDGYRKDKFRK